MWISVLRVDVGAPETTSGNMAAPHNPPVTRAPPLRPGLLLSHRPSAFASSSATTPATSTATATTTPLSAECYLSPQPSAPPAEEIQPRLPVTPPSRFKRFKIFIRSANKERRKRDERARDVATARQVLAAYSRPGQVGSTPPTRRSFRLTGGAPDPGCGHAMLPMWLEESNGVTFPVHYNSVVRGTEQDSSFERRWDSLINKSKVHSSCQTQRPPGWDNLTHRNASVKKDKRSNLCPSIVIQEPSRAWPATPISHKLPAPPASVRSRAAGQQTHHSAAHEQNAFNMRRFSEQMDEMFTDDFLQIPLEPATSTSSLESESSTSEVAQLSASITDMAHQSFFTSDPPQQLSSVSYAAQETASSDVVHQLSVTQQCYSDSGDVQQLSTSSEARLSSISETRPSTSNTAHQASFRGGSGAQASSSNAGDCHMWLSSDSFFCEDFSPSDGDRRNDEEAEYPQLDSLHSPSCPSVMQTVSPSTWADREPEDETEEEEDEMQLSASSSPNRVTGNTHSFDSLLNSSDTAINTDVATLRVADAPRRQHWVQFDSIPVERWTSVTPPLVIAPSAPPAETDFSHVEAPLQPSPPPSVPSLTFRERARSSPTHAGNYSGRLIRTYSQRGCRASKRVINSVSRRMSVTEYGRLSEPQAPMYSRAAMTMQTGPGLFEETASPTEPEHPGDEEKRFQPEELNNKPMSSLKEPAAPRRVGSMRAPRMSGALLRRSLSLNSPRKESTDVPFQKLAEQRPGSFRRALGALARSFRRKSNKPDTATNENGSTTHGKQMPQAPRLPRRAAKQSYASTHDWDRPARFV
ncbi:hypothetical protein E2C01_005583 [Portunus trituberculatus]|uniref:Uncharacterized protein n=1 Tax=Portunus trituberculatus TaxID=210409 RepID=A0A5B7CUP6_PORTR|nr:hypothetical protein [Portunus trituberculatus]